MKKIFIILLMIFGCGSEATLPPEQDIEKPTEALSEFSTSKRVIEIMAVMHYKLDLIIEHLEELEENPINLENEND